MVASDRISAYDFVLDTTIPDKGAVLTQMSLWWFEQLADLVPNHVLPVDVPAAVRGRAVVCESLDDVPRRVRGPRLPHRLRAARLPRRPARSAASRCPTDSSTAAGCRSRSSRRRPRRSSATTTRTCRTTPWSARSAPRRRPTLRDLTLRVYGRAESVARERGHRPGRHQARVRRPSRRHDRAGRRGAHPRLLPVLAGRDWQPGRAQPSYDKQIVRDWLTSPASGWDRTSGRGPAAAARRRRRAHPVALRRGLRAPHRPHVLTHPASTRA